MAKNQTETAQCGERLPRERARRTRGLATPRKSKTAQTTKRLPSSKEKLPNEQSDRLQPKLNDFDFFLGIPDSQHDRTDEGQ